MKATQATADKFPTVQRFATYAQGQLQIVEGDGRMNFDIGRPEKVEEWKRIVGKNSNDVYRLVVEQFKSPVFF